MAEQIIKNNIAEISGKVVSEFTYSHEVYGEGFYSFNVEVPRLSDSFDIIPVMVSEVIVRLGYAIKRIKEGNSIRASIPISLNREKHPKLATMLFIAHAGATAANAGKIYFTKNPMAINYPQWLAFAKYSYSQLKWVIINKPEAQNAYVMGKLNDELFSVIDSTNEMFEDFAKDYIVVFE